MEETKVCFKCVTEKPLSEFYKHKGMPDGHLGKCKECTKKDVREKYAENFKNPEYAERQRERGRDKYERLGYVNRKTAHEENKCSSRFLRSRGVDTTGLEIHHWNYNNKNDVFILDRRLHKFIHKSLIFDNISKCFLSNGILIDRKDLHKSVLDYVIKESKIEYKYKMYPEDYIKN